MSGSGFRVSVDEPCALEDLVEGGTLGYLRLEHRLQLGVGVKVRVWVWGWGWGWGWGLRLGSGLGFQGWGSRVGAGVRGLVTCSSSLASTETAHQARPEKSGGRSQLKSRSKGSALPD